MVYYLSNPINKFLAFIVISSIATFSTIDLLFLIEKSLTFQTIAFLAILLNIAIFILEIPTGIISDRVTPIKALLISTLFRATASFFYILDFKYHLYFATLFAAIGIAFLSGSMNSAIINMSVLNRSNEKSLSYLNFYKSIGLMIGGIIGYKTFSLNIQYPWMISTCLSILSCVFLLNINSFKKNQISRDHKNSINYLVVYRQLLSKPIFWCVIFFATSAVAPTMLWQLLFKEYQHGVIIGYVLLQSATLFSVE